MNLQAIEDRARQLIESLPEGVLLVAAAKTRTVEEILAAVRGGVTAVGHNYVQEAEAMAEPAWRIDAVGRGVQWRLIGHLQRNKAKRAADLFDVVETVDSVRLARALDRHCGDADKVMPVLIEMNSAEESAKSGVSPRELDALAIEIASLPNLRLQGLMTIGPFVKDPEELRPCFRRTREAFERLAAAGIEGVEMRYLSMGMSDSCQVAIEEGANIVRIGSRLFGPRPDTR